MRKSHKVLPEHIYAKWDPELLQWGIWNDRLHMWHGKDEYFGHTVYGSKEEALQQFLEHF